MNSLENWMRRRLLFLFSFFAAAWGLAAAPLAAQAVDEMDRPAVVALSPTKAVYLDVIMAGSRIVAVGERGLIIYSDDRGRTWRQAKVPTSISLTRVKFATPSAGWAVGHSGIVLHTDDGGQTWTRQLDGRTAAQLALDAGPGRRGTRRCGQRQGPARPGRCPATGEGRAGQAISRSAV